MSLDVPTALLDRAHAGVGIPDEEFVACVRDSLPYAWEVFEDVAARTATGDGFADHTVPPPSEQARGQLLRALASDAIRAAVERHFGVRFAFQNCHRVAAFAPSAVDGAAHREFVSVEAQLRNQSPSLRNC